jgi:hypothetical protein
MAAGDVDADSLPRHVGYIGHFTDSYIGVVDLDRTGPTYGQILLSVGAPTPPRATE